MVSLGSHKDWKQRKTVSLPLSKGNERKLYFVCFRQIKIKGHVLDYCLASKSPLVMSACCQQDIPTLHSLVFVWIKHANITCQLVSITAAGLQALALYLLDRYESGMHLI